MFEIFIALAVWFFLSIIAVFIASKLKISIALTEIMVGTLIGYFSYRAGIVDYLCLQSTWFKLLTSIGAIMLTFLAGSELQKDTLKTKFRESTIVGVAGFMAPFIGCFMFAHYVIQWNMDASLLTGIALSTTSMAVVYSVMLDYKFNRTEYGKGILGSCFINDLGTVIALSLIFTSFTIKTLIFLIVFASIIVILPLVTQYFIQRFAFQTAAFRTKWILFTLLSMAALAQWADVEPILPAYVIGMILSDIYSNDHQLIRRIRTLTIGFLSPLYFLRAGTLVSLPAIMSFPLLFGGLFAAKFVSKIAGVYPAIRLFRKHSRERWNYNFRKYTRERWYYTLLMSTGLTFGTISALYGLNNNIIDQMQYSLIVGAVLASAVIPTLIAQKFFMPSHLIQHIIPDEHMQQD